MWKVGQTSAHGKTPIGEAHGQEHVVVHPKVPVRVHQARRPVSDEGATARPELWPNAGGEIEDSDACTKASVLLEGVLLEGEQNMILPSVRSEQHAAPYTPRASSILVPLPPEILTRAIPRGEGAVPVRRATDECHLEGLEEPGGGALSQMPMLRLPNMRSLRRTNHGEHGECCRP